MRIVLIVLSLLTGKPDVLLSDSSCRIRLFVMQQAESHLEKMAGMHLWQEAMP